MSRPVVDKELCIGCENCTYICPEVFEMDEDGKSKVKNPDACNTCDCQQAIEECPVEAISWVD